MMMLLVPSFRAKFAVKLAMFRFHLLFITTPVFATKSLTKCSVKRSIYSILNLKDRNLTVASQRQLHSFVHLIAKATDFAILRPFLFILLHTGDEMAPKGVTYSLLLVFLHVAQTSLSPEWLLHDSTCQPVVCCRDDASCEVMRSRNETSACSGDGSSSQHPDLRINCFASVRKCAAVDLSKLDRNVARVSAVKERKSKKVER